MRNKLTKITLTAAIALAIAFTPAAFAANLSRNCTQELTDIIEEEDFDMKDFIKELAPAVVKAKAQAKLPFGKPKDSEEMDIGITFGCLKTFPESPSEIRSLLKDLSQGVATGAMANQARPQQQYAQAQPKCPKCPKCGYESGRANSSPEVKVSIRAGLNFTSLSRSMDYDYSYEYGKDIRTDDAVMLYSSSIGFHVGPVVDIKLLEFLYFQPGIMFSLKKASNESKSEYSYYNSYFGITETDSDHEKMTASAYYIDVPINLSLKGNLSPGYALTAHIGPYIGFGLSGDFEYEYKSNYSHNGYNDSNNDNNNTKLFEKDKNQDFILVNRFNMGIGFGVGLEISDFYIGANYNYGLTSLTTDEAAEKTYIGKIYERTLGISLGYGF